MKVFVKVKPNSSKQEIVEFGNCRYLVYLNSPAENNEANIELIKLLSKHLGVPPKSIKITFGATGKDKILEVN
jgi:uncharacterized protein YggU (UPF0235/DUF167 family)